jgi:cation/acetate symporter
MSAALAITVAGYFGINPPGFVAQVVAFAFGLAASSFFPAILMGIFSKRMNKEGAVAGMITGLGFTAGYIIYFKFINPDANTPENWWFGVSPEGIGTLGMIFNFIISYAVSRLTPEPPKKIKDLVDTIRIPKGAGETYHHHLRK